MLQRRSFRPIASGRSACRKYSATASTAATKVNTFRLYIYEKNKFNFCIYIFLLLFFFFKLHCQTFQLRTVVYSISPELQASLSRLISSSTPALRPRLASCPIKTTPCASDKNRYLSSSELHKCITISPSPPPLPTGFVIVFEYFCCPGSMRYPVQRMRRSGQQSGARIHTVRPIHDDQLAGSFVHRFGVQHRLPDDPVRIRRLRPVCQLGRFAVRDAHVRRRFQQHQRSNTSGYSH